MATKEQFQEIIDKLLDKREWSCVETKNERYHTMIMAGKVPITQWHTREVCITMKRN